jgi:hypothetical protein
VSEPADDPGEDPEVDEFADEFERDRDGIYSVLLDYMEQKDVGEGYAAQLLIDLMIKLRITAYGFGVESPSVAGLKLDLDRLRAEVGEFVREAKKGAEEYIVHIKEMRVEADALEKEDDKNGKGDINGKDEESPP